MRERILNTIGLGLLALCFVLSLGRILSGRFRDGAASGTDQTITLRMAHWQLENGVREAFDVMAAEYQKRHPHIRIVQIPIPERIYNNWLITQLVGETAPDMIQLGIGMTDERLARYFVPLSDLANSPNPYNQGTPLEGMPLRNTFFDGMLGGFNSNLVEYYGIPLSGQSTRMYYNLELLAQITGSESMPATYEELITLCRQAQEYAREKNLPLVPIAGSKYNAPIMLDSLFSSQTQLLVERLNPPGRLGADTTLMAQRNLAGLWTVRDPAYVSGLELLHEVGQYMQPGFIQLQRDDASLLFVQGRSLMICTGSWDATSIRSQAGFKVGVARTPLPSPNHPRYGRFTHGRLSEAGTTASVSFGLTHNSAHPEETRDFLRFISSQRISQLWADTSGWVPAIVGVQANEKVRPFLPDVEGDLPGIIPTIEHSGGLSEISRLYDNNWHLLFTARGGSEAFLQAVEPGFRDKLVDSLQRKLRGNVVNSTRTDSQQAALAWLSLASPAPSDDSQRWNFIRQSLAGNDRFYYNLKLNLEKNAALPR